MSKTRTITAILSASILMGMGACSGNVYDEQKHEQIIHYLSPVDSVDQHHTWQLTTNQTFAITANQNVGAEMLQVYTANPLTDASAELMNQVYISDGQTKAITVSVPLTLTTLYAALKDSDGLLTVTEFSTRGQRVDFSTPLGTKQRAASTTTLLQTFTYCYEENYPEPGDYDFNDVVMRISLERTGPKCISIHVTLQAVGAEKQLAGAIRLVGYRYQDIDSVTTYANRTYNEDVPDLSLNLITSTDNLLAGRNNEAVVNLFADAHWAMGEKLETSYGMFTRKKYNVSDGSGSGYQTIVTRTRTYNVYFKSETGLDGFTSDAIDPFVIVEYNGAKWEIHTEEFKDAQTFYNYNVFDFKDLPWALKIPMGDFRYPLEGCMIGFCKWSDGVRALFGAYMTEGHSFGEWTEDHTRYYDWYYYPTNNQTWK